MEYRTLGRTLIGWDRREIYSEKQDVVGLSMVFVYLVMAMLTVGWGVTMIAYMLVKDLDCVCGIASTMWKCVN